MRKISIFVGFLTLFILAILAVAKVSAQTFRVSPSPTAAPSDTPTPAPPRPDITQKTEETIEPLVELLREQKLGPVWPVNPLKYAIRAAVVTGVPANTIVLLLLLPLVAMVIAAFRHLIGLRGFGIFLPAALSVVFVATGPIVGIGLFLVIVASSTIPRIILRRLKLNFSICPEWR